MILLFACAAPTSEPPAKDTDTEPTDTGEPSCEPAPLPVESVFMRGYTGAEDFAFDAEGWGARRPVPIHRRSLAAPTSST